MTRWRGSRKRAAGRWDTTQVRLVRLDTGSAESALLREAVLEHDLPPEQLRFTGLPVRTLPDADQDPERVPYAIVALDGALTGPDSARAACAGFGVLDRVIGSELVDAPERAVLMRAYYVTPQWQGRGSVGPRAPRPCWTGWSPRSHRTPNGSCCASTRPTSRRSAPTGPRDSTSPARSSPAVRAPRT